MPVSDVFISYKSEQFSWARRLRDDLDRFGYSVFLDHDPARGLEVGEKWEKQLREEIRNAEAFLLLWSSRIPMASYVGKEIEIRNEAKRPITVVRLDDSALAATVDDETQAFREFIDLARGVDDADEVSFFAWNRAVVRLINSRPFTDRRSSAVVEIPLVVVAMTEGQAVELAEAKNVLPQLGPEKFQEVMNLLEQAVPFDPGRYGARPEEWKPFDAASDEAETTVEQVVARFDQARRSWQQDYADDDPPSGFAFVSYDDLLRNPATREQARRYLQAQPSVVVIDPVSLMHMQVHGDVMRNGLHTLQRAFVMGLGPQLTAATSPLQTYVRCVERELFEALQMDDPLGRSRSLFHPTPGTCVFNVCHNFEFTRWLHVASEHIAVTGRSRMAPAYEDVVRKGRATVPRMVFQGGAP